MPIQFGNYDSITVSTPPPMNKGRYGRHVTAFPSKKNDATVHCESLLEAEFCLNLEYLKRVRSYASQPFKINFKKEKITYTPDFHVTFYDGTEAIYEIKRDEVLASPSVLERYRKIRELFSIRDITFEAIAASTFNNKIRINNLQYFYFYSFDGSHKSSKVVSEIVSSRPHHRATIEQLLILGATPGDIAYAIFHNDVSIDLTKPAHLKSTPVWIKP